MRFSAMVMLGTGGLAASLLFGSGIASAGPDDAIVNSTCTYPQVMAALNAESPIVAKSVSASPMATVWLQQLVAAPPEQRRKMVEQARAVPQVQEYSGVIDQVVHTCNNY